MAYRSRGARPSSPSIYLKALAKAAQARGLKMVPYGDWEGLRFSPLQDWLCGIEFRDRQGRYASITADTLKDLELSVEKRFREYTPGSFLDEFLGDEKGLDVRLNRDLLPSKKQLGFNFHA